MSAINSLLTTANTLLNTHSDPRHASIVTALEAASRALQLAAEQGRPDLAARAELLRGHALREIGHWTRASECYERAMGCATSNVEVIRGVVVGR